MIRLIILIPLLNVDIVFKVCRGRFVLFLESGIKSFGIRNPSSTDKESTTSNPKSTAWNPESETALNFL